MTEISSKIAGYLLESKAVILEPRNPFTWASGWKSPIYCDNRITLSHPKIRDFIKEAFRSTILTHFNTPDIIAGVATGAIAQGSLVADIMNLPFVYVRPSAKEHGRQNLIEGHLEKGQEVLVVEDQIVDLVHQEILSTGGSSLKAVKALREAGANVLGMVAIFSYGFEVATENFRAARVELHTLTNYHILIETALATGYIHKEEIELLQQWREDPAGWKVK